MRPMCADRRLRPRFLTDRRPNDTLTSGRRYRHGGDRNRYRPIRMRIGHKADPSTSQQTSTESSATSSKAAPTTSAQASSPNKTIVDYIKDNNITETQVHRGDPGSPTINLPFPPGWQDAGNRTPAWAYAAILFSDPAMAQDPPTIIALVSRLT